jgi:site-specific recombinase XerD
MTPLAPLITAFFNQRLPVELGASENTRATYAYAMRLLLQFASERLATEPSRLHLEQLDSKLILDYLAHLENERGNCVSTRNTRLAAIKSFMRFVQYRVPSALEQILRILELPTKKTDKPVVCYLSSEEYEALFDAPEPTSWDGIRDRAMLYLAVTLGLRVAELVGLQVDDVYFDGTPRILVRGKGRKHRILPLWGDASKLLRAWLAIRGQAPVPELFLNARGINMTRAGFAYIVKRHVRVAAQRCPSILHKRVSPHVLRHTCAMETLRGTKDPRKVALLLGHADANTTNIYIHAELGAKLEIINTLTPPHMRKGRFRPPDKLMAMLKQVSLCGVRASRNPFTMRC